MISFISSHKAEFEKNSALKRLAYLVAMRRVTFVIEQIIKRLHTIWSSGDFLKDDVGLEKLGSIYMQLINIDEALKQVDKLTGGRLLESYPDIDWEKAKGKYRKSSGVSLKSKKLIEGLKCEPVPNSIYPVED